MSDSPRPAPLPKLEARPRTSPPTPSAKPPGEAETRPRPPKLPLAAPKPTSLPPVDPGLVDDGWSDRPPPVSRPAPVQKPEPAPKPSPKPALEKPREAPRAPAPVAKPPEPEPPPLDDLEPSPTQVAAAPPRPEPSPLLDSDATSTEIAAPGPPSDAALAATAERTSPATPIPDSSTHDAPFSPQLTEETHHGLRLSIPARLVERARALAPNLPAGVLRITPVRETPEEAVLRAALGLGLASLAALADADDEDA
ncbi:MAG: hypothetical protein KC619_04325 [Myxococcales bacterium]|nr:hypothetical protein [Myxococcales bacterium]